LAPVSAARKCSRGVRSRLLARMNNLPYTYVVVRARGSASSKLTKGFVGEVHSWQFSVDPRVGYKKQDAASHQAVYNRTTNQTRIVLMSLIYLLSNESLAKSLQQWFWGRSPAALPQQQQADPAPQETFDEARVTSAAKKIARFRQNLSTARPQCTAPQVPAAPARVARSGSTPSSSEGMAPGCAPARPSSRSAGSATMTGPSPHA
jgi:hypothetical protein